MRYHWMKAIYLLAIALAMIRGWFNHMVHIAADLVRLKRCAPEQICHEQNTRRPGQHHPHDHSLYGRHRISPRLIHKRDSQSVNSAFN
jgi:hypothetical protein